MLLLRKARIALTPRGAVLRRRLQNGVWVHGSNRAGHGGRGVYLFGDHLEPELAVLDRFLPRAGVFIDVGANTGVYALKAARHVGPAGRVLAVEPNPQMVEMLRFSMGENGLQNLLVVEACAAGTSGERVLWKNHGRPNSFSIDYRLDEAAGLPVRAVTLDELLKGEEVDRVDYVKIDAEGAEAEILAGAVRSIERFRPIVQVETSVRAVPLGHAGYRAFHAAGSLNTLWVPEESQAIRVPVELGWGMEPA